MASIIVHRCEDCGHPDIAHSELGGQCSIGYCTKRCDVQRTDVTGPSEVLATAAVFGTPTSGIHKPGSTWKEGGGLGGFAKLCGCDECMALYERESAA